MTVPTDFLLRCAISVPAWLTSRGLSRANQIEELAKATARRKSFVAIDALTIYLRSESWQMRDIHEGIKEADAKLIRGGYAGVY